MAAISVFNLSLQEFAIEVYNRVIGLKANKKHDASLFSVMLPVLFQAFSGLRASN